jgi:hypothetical protein
MLSSLGFSSVSLPIILSFDLLYSKKKIKDILVSYIPIYIYMLFHIPIIENFINNNVWLGYKNPTIYEKDHYFAHIVTIFVSVAFFYTINWKSNNISLIGDWIFFWLLLLIETFTATFIHYYGIYTPHLFEVMILFFVVLYITELFRKVNWNNEIYRGTALAIIGYPVFFISDMVLLTVGLNNTTDNDETTLTGSIAKYSISLATPIFLAYLCFVFNFKGLGKIAIFLCIGLLIGLQVVYHHISDFGTLPSGVTIIENIYKF